MFQFTNETTLQDQCEWLIDLGPFYDRFGPAVGLALDMSTDPTVVAIRQNFDRRKYINLQDPRVLGALNALIGLNVHADLTAALRDQMVTTPVRADENMALRSLYFGGTNGVQTSS